MLTADLVFVGDVALDRKTGNERWQDDGVIEVLGGAIVFWDGSTYVFANERDGTLVRDGVTGEVLTRLNGGYDYGSQPASNGFLLTLQFDPTGGVGLFGLPGGGEMWRVPLAPMERPWWVVDGGFVTTRPNDNMATTITGYR